MPIFPFSFSNIRAFDPIENRPLAVVRIVDPISGKRSKAYACLVDTGSDYTVLPVSAVHDAGLAATGGSKKIRGIAGAVTFDHEPGIQLVVEGYRITPKDGVCFDSSSAASFLPILGRVDLLTALKVAFDGSDWYWD